MKKVSDNKKKEILSFEKRTISDLRLKRVQGGSCDVDLDIIYSFARCTLRKDTHVM